MRTCQLLVVLGGALLLSACGAADTGDAADEPLGPVVETGLGTLEGERVAGEEGALVFRGVPYAEPPVGDSRWSAPIARASWEGARSAATFGPACWQQLTPESSIYTRGDLDRNEDCLYLNVWTAAEQAAEARPVMVWFHGGGHTGGWGSAQIFDGTSLANKGVVLVTINYRLGPFGFLAHPGADRGVAARRVRQLRAARQGGGPRMGARQHRGLRRRSGQRDHLRPVGRLVERLLPDGVAAGQRLVPQGYRPLGRLLPRRPARPAGGARGGSRGGGRSRRRG